MCLTRLSRVGVGGGGGGGSGRNDGGARERPGRESVAGAARNPPWLIKCGEGDGKPALEDKNEFVS